MTSRRPVECAALGDLCDYCFYCRRGLPFTRSGHQHDHFPIPLEAGGAELVAACSLCHDLKDRVAWDRWPVNAMLEGLFDVIGRWPPAYVAGTSWDPVSLAQRYVDTDMTRVLASDEWRSAWADLGTDGRLVFAKMARLAYAGQGVPA